MTHNSPQRLRFAALSLGLVTLLTSCGRSGSDSVTAAPDAASETPTVLTTFYPTTYFVQRIAGDSVEVSCPVPADADPIFWQPSAEAIGQYQAADLIVLNGAGFEKWAPNAALPRSRVIDTAQGFASEFITIESKTHSHGTAGSHTHEGLDGHTWLDPVNAVAQARVIGEALGNLVPDEGEQFLANFEDLVVDLQTLDARLQVISAARGGTVVLASHPAYNYLSRRYDWDITSFDLDPGDAITPDQLAAIEAARNADPNGRTVMLWESEPIEENVTALDDLGVDSVVFSPAEMIDPDRLAAGEDYLSVMDGNLDRLANAFRP